MKCKSGCKVPRSCPDIEVMTPWPFAPSWVAAGGGGANFVSCAFNWMIEQPCTVFSLALPRLEFRWCSLSKIGGQRLKCEVNVRSTVSVLIFPKGVGDASEFGTLLLLIWPRYVSRIRVARLDRLWMLVSKPWWCPKHDHLLYCAAHCQWILLLHNTVCAFQILQVSLKPLYIVYST